MNRLFKECLNKVCLFLLILKFFLICGFSFFLIKVKKLCVFFVLGYGLLFGFKGVFFEIMLGVKL